MNYLALLLGLNIQPYTKLEINNPYSSVSLKLEVKCDHDYKLNKYRFHKIFVIRRGGDMTLYTPSNLKKCEIWPLGFKMFGNIK